MTSPKTAKQKITEVILAEMPEQQAKIYRELPFDDLLFRWWFTGRQDGLRLTDEGVVAFELAQIDYYDINLYIKNISHYNFVLQLHKKIKCPYYLGVNKIDKTKKFYIRLYDSKIAMMVNLYGNIQDYLNSIRDKNDRRKEK